MKVDFKGRVRFLEPHVGGRQHTPMLGNRSDFRYVGQTEKNVWIIWPLCFLVDGEEVPKGVHVPLEVEVGFFILDGELLESVHRHRLQPGVKFEMCEGGRTVALGEVTEVLLDDPTD